MPLLPDLRLAVVSPGAMRRIEDDAGARGIPASDLMARAGRAIAELVRGRFPPLRRVLVLAGTGNNGGDGLVAAHWLQHWGYDVSVLPCGDRMVTPPGVPEGTAPRLIGPGASLEAVARPVLGPGTVVLDAVLGTGASRPLAPAVSGLFAAVRQAGCTVVAVDCPSGVSLQTGQADPGTLPATLTASLGAAKWGHYAWPAAGLRGELVVLPIGLPAASASLADGWRLDAARLPVIPERPASAHKGYARLTLVAGSATMPGAACLAGRAALRAGATYLSLATAPAVIRMLAAALPEAVWLPASPRHRAIVQEALGRSRALAIGPGLGTSPQAQALVRDTLDAARAAAIPAVVDADALLAVAAAPELLPPGSLLTPHPGELGRMLGVSTAAIEADRFAIAAEAAARFRATVILKGPHSIVATPGEPLLIQPEAQPSLATAGSGDVLTGVCGALLAQGLPAPLAARTGVAWHLAAARAAQSRLGNGITATDLASHLPLARPYPLPHG